MGGFNYVIGDDNQRFLKCLATNTQTYATRWMALHPGQSGWVCTRNNQSFTHTLSL